MSELYEIGFKSNETSRNGGSIVGKEDPEAVALML